MVKDIWCQLKYRKEVSILLDEREPYGRLSQMPGQLSKERIVNWTS
jgi:hypothetical protein